MNDMYAFAILIAVAFCIDVVILVVVGCIRGDR